MADNVQVGWNYTVAKDTGSKKANHSFSYTPASSYKGNFVQSIATSVTTIVFPQATTIKSFSAINRDLTNYVELFTDATGVTPYAKLAAGESQPPLNVKAGVPVFGKANTGAIKLEIDFDGAS